MIDLQNLTAGKTNQPLIRNIEWQIESGQHWAITGDIGSGKTILQDTLAGKTRIFEGNITYSFLQNPTSYEERKSAIKLVSFTDPGRLFNSPNAVHYYQQRYQAFDSDGHLSVLDYLEAGGLDLDNSGHQFFMQAMHIEPLLLLECIKLSSGQFRKILLLKAILKKPTFLLLDNAHLGLDDASRQILNDYIDLIATNEDQQFILSGHFRSLPKCVTQIIELKKGRIVMKGAVRSKVPTKNGHSIENTIPEALANHFKKSAVPDFKTVLKFEAVAIKYKNRPVFQELNWTVRKGEKWTLQGPNGSGKSTLISLIYGDHPQAYSNKVTLFDKKRGTGESIWDIKQKIGFSSPELHNYFKFSFKTLDVILSGLTDTLYHTKSSAEHIAVATSFLAYFNLIKIRDEPFNTLSTGTQRLVFLIRALIKAPPVLLLDEPYQGLDQKSVLRCNHLLTHLLSEEHTLIFISHFKDEIPDIIQHHFSLD